MLEEASMNLDKTFFETHIMPVEEMMGFEEFTDFAARMDRCVLPYSAVNHNPVAVFNGSLNQTVSPGQTVTLNASGSSDPDGNSISYKWWQYYEADSASTKVTISNDTSMSGASFTVPNEPGKTIHIILEVKDNGSPNLKAYQRIIYTIGS